MKNGNYKFLLPSFYIKILNYSISIFLSIACIKLFLLHNRWGGSCKVIIYLTIIIIFLCFLILISNRKNYLLNMFITFCIGCALISFIANTHPYDKFDIYLMRILIFCLGLTFMSAEILHSQMTENYIEDKWRLSASMGIVSCILAFQTLAVALNMNNPYLKFSIYLPTLFLCYLIYALYVLMFPLWKKKIYKLRIYSIYIFIFFLFLEVSMIPIGLGVRSYDKAIAIITLKIWMIFGCIQLIPIKENSYREISIIGNFSQISSFFFRIIYFAALSFYGSFSWSL
jgi:hypothetical protein